MSHTTGQPTTSTEPAASAAATARKPHIAGALLPFIGVFLFAIATIKQVAEGLVPGWQTVMIANGVTYLVGWSLLGAGISHLFFGRRISSTIGFAPTEYQFEVGAADVAMGAAALMATSYGPDYWWAVILISSIFRVICGVGHIRSMIRDRNFAPNNTTILLVNFGVPAFLILSFLAWI
jgi:hypothetical protein